MLNKILIVTQTPPAFRKHPGGDRTGDFLPRAKLSAELSKVINDGLYYYEQDLWDNAIEVSNLPFGLMAVAAQDCPKHVRL